MAVTQKPNAKNWCPKCKSEKYLFRSRKKVAADAEKGEPEAVETKYKCSDCGHDWRVKVAVQ